MRHVLIVLVMCLVFGVSIPFIHLQPTPLKGRVCWKSEITGYQGHGQLIDYRQARKAAEWANKEYPNIEHWVEER